MLVQQGIQAGLGGNALQTGVITNQRGGADDHIDCHKYHQAPGQNGTAAAGQAFNQAVQRREQHLEPCHSGQPPEKAVQQIDTPAQVERQGTVIPEYRAEHDFGKHAAQILVSTAQQGAHAEQPECRTVFVLVQNLGDQRNGKAPNNRERSPHQAGTAHPIPSGNAAENRFGNVAQERADYKQQKDFVKAAPGSKHRAFGALGAYQVQLRGLGAHAALGAVKNPQPHPQRQVGKAVVDLVHSGQLVAQAAQGQRGAQQINDQQNGKDPQQNMRKPGGHQLVQTHQQRHQPLDGYQAQGTPDNGSRKADVPIQVPFAVRVIPPAGVAVVLQQMPGNPFHHRGIQRAEQKQEEPPAAQFPQGNGDQAAGNAVNQAQRPVQHAAVPVLAQPHCGGSNFQAPAQERKGQKQPE